MQALRPPVIPARNRSASRRKPSRDGAKLVAMRRRAFASAQVAANGFAFAWTALAPRKYA